MAIVGFAGVTAIDWRVVAVTVSTVDPLMEPSVAEMVEVPVPTAVARPAVVIVATDVVAEAQLTWPVRSCVVLSLYVPVAVNCWVSPLAMLGLAGVTVIDWSAAVVTVSTVEPLMEPSVAEIVEVPVPTAVASPVVLMDATDVVAEAHET